MRQAGLLNTSRLVASTGMGTGGGGRKRARIARDTALAPPRGGDGGGGQLFVVDRTKATKEVLAGQNAKDARAEKRRMRRGIVKIRKSEYAAVAEGDGGKRSQAGAIAGKKKKKFAFAGVDLGLLENRKFVGPAERARKNILEAEKMKVSRDVWSGELAVEVDASKSKERKNIECQFVRPVRATAALLRPDDGESVNPMLEAHQDALGEAVGMEISRVDKLKWEQRAIRFDPKILLEKPLHVASDDDDVDSSEEATVPEANRVTDAETEVIVHKLDRPRRTRRDKNRANRRRTQEALRVRKATHAKISEQIDQLDKLSAEADAEALKLQGADAKAAQAVEQAALAADGKDAAAARPTHKALGGVRVPTEKDLNAVPLSDDLSSNLRSVGMPVSNPVVRDRFLAYQRRGFIEPPAVTLKEKKQAKKDKIREEQRDRMIRKGRGSRSNMTYWRKPRKR